MTVGAEKRSDSRTTGIPVVEAVLQLTQKVDQSRYYYAEQNQSKSESCSKRGTAVAARHAACGSR
jgi:methionyl-tRNA synthetase